MECQVAGHVTVLKFGFEGMAALCLAERGNVIYELSVATAAKGVYVSSIVCASVT